MKAVVAKKAGPPEILEYTDVQKPHPKDNELLIKVKAATVTSGDVALQKFPRFVLWIIGALFGFKAHKITGTEFAGIVEETGSKVTLFKKGDEVIGTTTGLVYGANAEYVCVPEKWKTGVVIKKLPQIPFDEAAARKAMLSLILPEYYFKPSAQ